MGSLVIGITDKHIRIVKGKNKENKEITIECVDFRELPSDCIVNGCILKQDNVCDVIKEILTANNISDREAVVCLNSSSMIYKELTLPRPRSTGEYALRIIESMICNIMSLSDNYAISYIITGETKENNAVMYKIAVTACPLTLTDGYIALFKQIGLRIKCLCSENTCISRLVLRERDYEPFMLLQVYSNFVGVSYYQNGDVPFSGFITFNSDYQYSELSDNLFRIIHFLEQQNIAAQINEIQYCGFILNKESLHYALSELNIDISEILIPETFNHNNDIDFCFYAGLLGAFYKTDKRTESINFTNLKSNKKRNAFFNIITAVVMTAVCISIIFGTAYYFNLIKNDAEERLRLAEAEYHALNYDEKLQEVNEKKSGILEFNSYIEKIEIAKALFNFQPKMTSDIIEMLTSALLPEMKIASGVSVNSYNVNAVFYCSLPEQPALYVEALMKQDYFTDINFNGYTINRNGDEENQEHFPYLFELNMKIKGGNLYEQIG